jgi:hypothetical protein
MRYGPLRQISRDACAAAYEQQKRPLNWIVDCSATAGKKREINHFHGISARLRCAHRTTIVKPTKAPSTHHAALKCADCGAFLRWLPKPETIERRLLTGFKLAKLQMCPGLNAWESEFLQSVSKKGNGLSPKQQAVFDRLCSTYLERGQE